jgi:hypothetical protein
MSNRYFTQEKGTITRGVVRLFGDFTTTTSGTISTTSGANHLNDGFTVAKTSAKTGRYTITLEDVYTRLLGVNVIVQGADDSLYTDDKGLKHFIRAVNLPAKTLYLQFACPGTNITDGAITVVDGAITVTESAVELVGGTHTSPTTAAQSGTTATQAGSTAVTVWDDAELEDGAKVFIELVLKDSSV